MAKVSKVHSEVPHLKLILTSLTSFLVVSICNFSLIYRLQHQTYPFKMKCFKSCIHKYAASFQAQSVLEKDSSQTLDLM